MEEFLKLQYFLTNGGKVPNKVTGLPTIIGNYLVRHDGITR